MDYDVELDMEAVQQPKILLVEDSEPDKFLIEQKVMTLWPQCVFIATSSMGGAYKAFKEHHFDLVLLDLNLEDTLGPNSVQEIRKFNRSVPIIVITGMLNSVTADESLRMGANNVFPKSSINESDDFFNLLEQNVTGLK